MAEKVTNENPTSAELDQITVTLAEITAALAAYLKIVEF
jgi:hypothetical protein